MINIIKVLLKESRKPVNGGWVIPIANGRFILTENLDVRDTETLTTYTRDESVPLALSAFDIPGLTTEPVNVAKLFALCTKPLEFLTDEQKLAKTNFTPQFVNRGLDKSMLDADDFYWKPQEGGFDGGDGRMRIPGFKNFRIDLATGKTYDYSLVAEGVEVIPGTNRGTMIVIVSDGGQLTEVDSLQLSRFAAGQAELEELLTPAYFADGDDRNWANSNITMDPNVNNAASGPVADPNADYVLGNEV